MAAVRRGLLASNRNTDLFWINAVGGVKFCDIFSCREFVFSFFDGRSARYASFFYATAPIHYFAIGWEVNFSYVLLMTWSLLWLMTWLKKKYLLATGLFLLAIATNEIAMVLPILGLLLTGYKNRKTSGFFYFLLLIGYFGVRLKLGLRTVSDYQLSFALPIQSFRWYGLWMLGWSDIIRDHMVGILSFRRVFVSSFPEVAIVYLIELGATVYLLFMILRDSVKSKKMIIDILQKLLWIIIALLPVIFFPQHYVFALFDFSFARMVLDDFTRPS